MPTADPSYRQVADGPYTAAAVVTPSDVADLPQINAQTPLVTRALAIGVAGTINVDMATGGTAVPMTVAAGVIRLCVTRVRATGTSATNIVALY